MRPEGQVRARNILSAIARRSCQLLSDPIIRGFETHAGEAKYLHVIAHFRPNDVLGDLGGVGNLARHGEIPPQQRMTLGEY